MAHHIELGRKGEEIAVNYFKKNNFTILDINWRVEHLEIDIIAMKNEIIHFIEVKTRKKNSLVPARESLSYKKQKNLERLVELWYMKNPHVNNSAQLDFIAISMDSKGEYTLEYFPNYTV